LAIALAKKINSVILSADSRQFYRETSIGTAKPSLQEQAGIQHYFINSHSIHQPVTSAQFEKEALSILEEEFQRHETIILVGGSGLFIDALCHGLDDVPHDENIKNQLNIEFETQGLSPLLNELEAKDPLFFNKVDLKNPVRIIRALEVIRITDKPFSSFHAFQAKNRPFEFQKFIIDLPRERLYERINKRVDIMVENGLLQEVQDLIAWQNLSALNTVGYSELFDYFNHKISLEEAIELIKRNSRRYAKRQLTWFRRDEKAIWIQELTTENQLQKIISYTK
jgi:tRNA dimethylallyltransferase